MSVAPSNESAVRELNLKGVAHPRAISRRIGYLLALVLLNVGAAQSAFAQGGPPMLTDDPGTPGDGMWEINFAYSSEDSDRGRVRSVPHVDVNYGLGDRIQLKYETGRVSAAARQSGPAESGIDDSLFGLKWRFLDQERVGFDMSLYPQLQVENSARAVAKGIAEPGPNLLLPVEVGVTRGRMKFVGEIGYQYLRAAQNEWVVGLLGAFEMSEKRELMAEIHSVGERFLSDGDVILNVGLRQQLSSRVRLLASVATGLTHGADATRSAVYVGVQLSPGQK